MTAEDEMIAQEDVDRTLHDVMALKEELETGQHLLDNGKMAPVWNVDP